MLNGMEHSQAHTNRAALCTDTMLSLMRYKRWADTELMSAADALSGFGRFLAFDGAAGARTTPTARRAMVPAESTGARLASHLRRLRASALP